MACFCTEKRFAKAGRLLKNLGGGNDVKGDCLWLAWMSGVQSIPFDAPLG
ncbi:hypothetical protein [Bacteroides salyersiae]|nr:hypothetical protein [Bacteroides salyersiae]UYU40945.1 hypothetical protein KQP71_00310 [Bacteroides salyersiae]